MDDKNKIIELEKKIDIQNKMLKLKDEMLLSKELQHLKSEKKLNTELIECLEHGDKILYDYQISLKKLLEYIEIIEKSSNDKTVMDEIYEMKKLIKQEQKQVKRKLISVSEFTEIYKYGEDTQKSWRNRLPQNNPLPYIQIGEDGKKGHIRYNIEKIEKWLENYEKN